MITHYDPLVGTTKLLSAAFLHLNIEILSFDADANVVVYRGPQVITVFDHAFHDFASVHLVYFVMNRPGIGISAMAQAVGLPLGGIGYIHGKVASVVIDGKVFTDLV